MHESPVRTGPLYMAADRPAGQGVSDATDPSTGRDTDPSATSGRKRLVIHAGLHKTGTTSLQKWLLDHKAVLDPHLLAYNLADGSSNPLKFATHAYVFGPGSVVAIRTEARKLAAEIAAAPQPVALYTDEGLLGVPLGLRTERYEETRIYPRAAEIAAILATEFAQFDTRVVLYERDAEPWLRSLHNQMYKQGSFSGDYDAYLAAYAPNVDWAALADRIETGLGDRARLVRCRFEDEMTRPTVADMAVIRELGLPAEVIARLRPDLERINVSQPLSAFALERQKARAAEAARRPPDPEEALVLGEEGIRLAYRLFLGRTPSEGEVKNRVAAAQPMTALRRSFLMSQEFTAFHQMMQQEHATAAAPAAGPVAGPAAGPVSTATSTPPASAPASGQYQPRPAATLHDGMIRVTGVNWPGSGHDMLVRLLQHYYGPEIGYCPFYRTTDACCHSVPCTRADIHLSKNHDFTLDTPQVPGRTYLVQYRDFPRSVVSNFELYVRDGNEDSETSFLRYVSEEFTRYEGFLDRWVRSDFAQDQLVVRYEDMLADPEGELTRVLERIDPTRPADPVRVREAVQSVDGEKVENKTIEVSEKVGVHADRDLSTFRYHDPEIFALLPRLRLTRQQVDDALRQAGRRATGPREMLRLQCAEDEADLARLIAAGSG